MMTHILSLFALLSVRAVAQDVELEDGSLSRLLSRARADEHFFGLGDERNTFVREGIDVAESYGMGAIPKVNQAYVWGLTHAEGSLFFGTVANGAILARGSYSSNPSSYRRFYDVAEYGDGIYGRQLGLPPAMGDWRPPLMARYSLGSGETYDLTLSLTDEARSLWLTTEGLRAIGAAPGLRDGPPVVLMAGPPIDKSQGGIAVFAFDARDGAFLGATELPEYLSIRRWATYGNHLYAAVHRRDGRGAVVRWVNAPERSGFPLLFKEVGRLDQPGSDICVHQGRLFATTWPAIGVTGFPLPEDEKLGRTVLSSVGLWMSPPIPPGGLSRAHAGRWNKVWSILNYDPDPLVGLSGGGGALESFDGWLYFGTMHLPGMATIAYNMVYDLPNDPASQGALMWNTWRSAAIFRMRDFRPVPVIGGVPIRPGGDIELLYGNATFLVYDDESGEWTPRPNRLGQTPSMGGAGFGDMWNLYTWSMQAQADGLYVGTQKMKFASDIDELRDGGGSGKGYGGELHRLTSSSASEFTPVCREGVGNVANNGIRSMTSDGRTLYVGTANACNLFGDPDDDLPDGGYELRAILRSPDNISGAVTDGIRSAPDRALPASSIPRRRAGSARR